jgi:hypothetical protein
MERRLPIRVPVFCAARRAGDGRPVRAFGRARESDCEFGVPARVFARAGR